MSMLEEGDTLLFESQEYLIMKKVHLKGHSYFVLASKLDDFQLIVCQIISDTEIERILDQTLVKEVLFQIAVS